MKFQVLGPVAVSANGEPLNIGGLKQRTVLATLLARRPHPVSADLLAGAVYGHQLPDRARRRIQTYVSTLRAILGDVIIKDGDGWSLTVADEQVDATWFERLYESAIGQQPDAASEILREALSLWRGVPFGSVEAHGELDAEITRLTELCATTLHARIEADLHSGRHAEVIGELESLIDEHPYHEQFRAQHMLALYRSGRQRDALRSFAQLRERLVDELGVDPSPELQRLEGRILDHDDTLLAPRTPTARAVTAENSAVRFPSPQSSLVGRQTEIERLVGLLEANRLVTMTGLGGCGKTRLAIETGRRLFDQFADGVHFADLRAVVRDDEVAPAVAAAIGVGAGGGEPLVRVGEYLSDKRSLVLLDNCEHLLDGCAEFVEGLLRYSGDWRLLATSREALYVDGEQLYPVPPLSADDQALELFRARAAALDPDFVVDDEDRRTVRELCGRLDHMPLAIELAAARTTVMSPAELLRLIDDRFSLLSGGYQRSRNRTRTLEATLEWSYDLLDDAEQRLFGVFGVFAGPIEPSEIAAVAEIPLGEAIELVDSLVAKSLVVTARADGSTRLRMLETVQAYATTKLAEVGRLEAARELHLRHYVEASLSSDVDFGQFASANIDAAIDWAIATERWADAAHLLIAEGHMWHRSDYFPAWGNLRNARSKLQRLEMVSAALGPRSELGELLNVTEINLALADLDEARVLDAARRASQAQNLDVRVWGLHTTAIFVAIADPSEALHCIELAEQLNDDREPRIVARSYVHMFAGEYSEALAGFETIDRSRARWHDANAATLLLLLDRPVEALAMADGHPAAGSCWNAYHLISGLAKLSLGRLHEAEAQLVGIARGAVDGRVPYVANTSLIGLAALLAKRDEVAWASEILLAAPSQRVACVYALARMVAAPLGVLEELIALQVPGIITKGNDATVLLRQTLERWDEQTYAVDPSTGGLRTET